MRWSILVVASCGGDPTDMAVPDGEGDADTDADTDTDTDVDADADTDVGPITISAPSFRLHADYGTVAYVGWTQDVAGSVRVEASVDAGVWLTTPEVTRDAGTWEQVVLGLPYDVPVTWRVVAGGVQAHEATDTTGAAPSTLPLPTLEISDPTRWYPDGDYLLTSVNTNTGGWSGPGPFWTVLVDRAGRVVWARRTPEWTLFAQVSVTTGAHLLIDEDTMWADFDDGAGSRVVRATLESDVETIATPGLQHAFVELPDGTLAWGSYFHHWNEALVELAPGATDASVLWAPADDWPGVSSADSNGLFYDAVTDSYLYSFWTNHSIAAIDRTSGQTLWWAGTVPGGYDFVPSSSSFWLQHGVSYTAAGTLLLSSEESGPTTVAREYEVDHAARELREVWTFDADVHAVTNGDALRLANGNTLHVVGSAGVVDEVTADGTIVWQIDWHAERLLGHGEFVSDLYALAD